MAMLFVLGQNARDRFERADVARFGRSFAAKLRFEIGGEEAEAFVHIAHYAFGVVIAAVSCLRYGGEWLHGVIDAGENGFGGHGAGSSLPAHNAHGRAE